LTEQGLTSHQTHYRSYRGWVLAIGGQGVTHWGRNCWATFLSPLLSTCPS